MLEATAEFDRLGRDTFLERYGFARSRGYFVVLDGKLYDSKAIAGVAHRYLNSESNALRPSQFSGGDHTVAPVLRRLGFVVSSPKDQAFDRIPFEVGRTYHRQRDIHQVYGGQERGGICTPAGVPYVFLFTGESGEQFGYSDGWQGDGTFAYTGEGQNGDMEFIRGNRAIRDHLQDGRDLLLFEARKTKGQYQYIGCFAFAGWSKRDAPDREGMSRKGIVFQLVPNSGDEAIGSAEMSATSAGEQSLEQLRAAAYAAAVSLPSPPADAKRSYYARSEKVKAYVLARAKGLCEACGLCAPFQRKDGTPYLEPHHTRRIADGGPDHPRWVGAICPNCHRQIHHGADGHEVNSRLEQALSLKEPPRSADNHSMRLKNVRSKASVHTP